MLVENTSDYIEKWNKLSQSEIEEVFLLTHSNGHSIIFTEGTNDGISVDGTDSHDDPIGDIRDLSAGNITYLHLYSCNSGFLGYIGMQNVQHDVYGTIAETYNGIGVPYVFSFDGELAYGESGIARLFHPFDYHPRLSNNQGGFDNLSEKTEYGGSPNGWVQFDGDSSTYVIIGEAK